MIDFRKVKLSDKNWMQELLAAADMRGCHQNYTNIFAWSEVNKYLIARIQEYLVVKMCKEPESPVYFYPAGKGAIKTVLETMKQDAAERGHVFKLVGLSEENMAELESLYPGVFSYRDNRDYFDYIYSLEKLVTLAGKKNQAKRNHINRFKANYSWSFEEITAENLAECWEMNEEWCRRNDCEDIELLLQEYCAVSRCFKNYDALGLEGALLRVEGRVVAYTMGEILNSDTYVIHIEKAFSDIRGAYQMINREFAAVVQKRYPHLVYVNREEDLGFEGLRKAKLSYHPEKMEKKYEAEYTAG